MGKKRNLRKPVALTFADTSNQPTSGRDAEGSSRWRGGEAPAGEHDSRSQSHNRPENNEDEVECVGMVSSSTATADQRKARQAERELQRRQQEKEQQRILQQEEEDLQRAIELSRLEMRNSSAAFPNSTSEDILDGDGRDDPGNQQRHGGQSSSCEEEEQVVSLIGEAQTSNQTSSTHPGKSVENDLDDDDEDDDETDISDMNDDEIEFRGGGRKEGEAGGGGGGRRGRSTHAISDDSDACSVGSSILQESDEEITAGQPEGAPRSSSNSPTQSSQSNAVTTATLTTSWQPQSSLDVFNMEASPELYAYDENDGSESSDNEQYQVPVTTPSQDLKNRSPTVENRRTRLSRHKRKRSQELEGEEEEAEGSQRRSASGSESKPKAPRLGQEQDSDIGGHSGSDEEVEVDGGEEEGGGDTSDSGPSQEASFIDFPKRFPDGAGAPLVDCRKPNHKNPFLLPPGVLPSSYTSVILKLFCQYQLRLLKAQAQQRRRINFGKPVVTGPHVKDTIVHRKRGQKIFKWQYSDEEDNGSGLEEVPKGSDQRDAHRILARPKPKPTNWAIPMEAECSTAAATASTPRVELRNVTSKMSLAEGKFKSVSGNVNGIGENDSSAVKVGDEVSSSRMLVSKVKPLGNTSGSPAGGGWRSKANMAARRENRRRPSASDDSDTDVELVVENTSPRTPLTAAVSPRVSHSEALSGDSSRSPVFGGQSNNRLMRQSRVRKIGLCSPRTIHNRDKMESPQPSSPRLRPEDPGVVEAAAESASGVSSTVPDREVKLEAAVTRLDRGVSTSGTHPSNEPLVALSTDTVASEARNHATSTNHIEQGSDTGIHAKARVPESESFEESRMSYYRSRLKRLENDGDGNGIAEVGSSSVNRLNEASANSRTTAASDGEDEGSVGNSGPSNGSDRLDATSNARGERVIDLTPQEDDHEERRDDEEEAGNSQPLLSSRSNEAAEGTVSEEFVNHEADDGPSGIGGSPSMAEEKDQQQQQQGDERGSDQREETVAEEPGGETDKEEGGEARAAEEVEADMVEEGEEEEEEGEAARRDRETGSNDIPCPLCGDTFPLNIIEVHASGCEGPVQNRVTPPRGAPSTRGARSTTTRPRDSKEEMAERMEMLDRTSSEDEDGEEKVTVTDMRPGGSGHNYRTVRKRTFPSSEGTSDSPTSSVGSMSHFDKTVYEMLRKNEIKMSSFPPSRTSDRSHLAAKRAKLLSKSNSKDVEAIDINDDDDEDEVEEEEEKCFICSNFIPKSLYQTHVQNELDRMENENSLVESSSSSSTATRTRRQTSSAEAERDGAVVSGSASTSSLVAAAVGTRHTVAGPRARRGRPLGVRQENASHGGGGCGSGRGKSSANGRIEATSTTDQEETMTISSSDEAVSGPNSPSALDEYLLDSDDDDNEGQECDEDDEDDPFDAGEEEGGGGGGSGRDVSNIAISDSPIKAFRSLKQNPPCLIDFKNQFKEAELGRTPRRPGGRGKAGQGGGTRGRGRGKGKWRGKWKSGKKWGKKQ